MNDSTHLEESIFAGAVDLPPSERQTFVERSSGGDRFVVERVMALLRGYEEKSGFLEYPAAAKRPAASNPGGITLPADPAPGDRVGRYKILDRIGEGACGVVYMAEQMEPVYRRVALKVIKLGLDTREFITRFEAERQALARMDHPNIARVFDAGATETGRPFFVMELIRGVPVTQFCDENRLATAARLELFIQICHAIQHAHQKGVIHRDIKPSNILISVSDGPPSPKVIDFGIAKATQGRLTERTLLTRLQAFIGTPAYASPEQIEMSALDIDTRSDVYSLGALLYELLTGHQPFDPKTLAQASLEEVRRLVRDVEPPRPSKRLLTLSGQDRALAAQLRSTDAIKLSVLLSRDLDWIVMRCLDKDRIRRYETANGLARDVQRFLDSEPVAARPPSGAYRLRKFIHRHKTGFVAASVVATALVAGLIVSSVLFLRERVARARAVAAEGAESHLRQQAEAAREQEIRRASQTALNLAARLLGEGKTAEALAYFVHAARQDPANSSIAPRLISTLVYRNFPLPFGNELRHTGPVNVLGFADDGRRLVTTSADKKSAFVWDIQNSLLVVGPISLASGAAWVYEVALSPGGRQLAASLNDGSIWLWDVKTGQPTLGPLNHFRRPPSTNQSPRSDDVDVESTAYSTTASTVKLTFSPDGRLLVSHGAEGAANIWDVATGKLIATLSAPQFLSSIQFSPDLARVVTTSWSEEPWRVWSVADGRALTDAMPAVMEGYSACFSPDGQRVVVADVTGAQVWDWAKGARIGPRLPHDHLTVFSTFFPDGRRVLTASADRTIKIWNASDGTLLVRITLPDVPVEGRIILARDGRTLYTQSSDGTVRLWDADTGLALTEPIQVDDNTAARLSPDGNDIWTGGRDGRVRRWRLGRGAAQVLRVDGLVRHFNMVQPSVDLRITGNTGQLLDLRTGKSVGPALQFPSVPVTAWISPKGRYLVVTTAKNESFVWDLHVPPITGFPIPNSSWAGKTPFVTFDLEERRVAIAEGFPGGQSRLTIRKLPVGDVAFGPVELSAPSFFPGLSRDNRRVAAGTMDGKIRLWDTSTGKSVGASMDLEHQVNATVFSPDEARLATVGGGGRWRIWDTATGRPITQVLRHGRIRIDGIQYTRDGHRLLTHSYESALVWDADRAVPIAGPMSGESTMAGAIFSEDERRVIGMFVDGTLRAWDARTGLPLFGPLQTEAAGFHFRVASVLAGTGLVRFNVSDHDSRRSCIVAIPDVWDSQPTPEWLLRLAGAVSGGEIAGTGDFRKTSPTSSSVLLGIAAELEGLPDSAPYVEWGRWFLAERATRSIAPGFTITPAEAKKLTGDGP